MQPLHRHSIYYKKMLHFFNKYNNEWKEHSFQGQKIRKKAILTKTKNYLRKMT